MNFLVIDGNSILNRAFYGIKVLTTKDGRFTNAIYGFMNIFLRLKDECQPEAVAVAFDVKQPTFRHEMYGGYKATRKGMPDELAQQRPDALLRYPPTRRRCGSIWPRVAFAAPELCRLPAGDDPGGHSLY